MRRYGSEALFYLRVADKKKYLGKKLEPWQMPLEAFLASDER